MPVPVPVPIAPQTCLKIGPTLRAIQYCVSSSLLLNTFPSFLDFLGLAGLPFILQPQLELSLYSAVTGQRCWLDKVTVIFLPEPCWMNAEKLIRLPELEMLSFNDLVHITCRATR